MACFISFICLDLRSFLLCTCLANALISACRSTVYCNSNTTTQLKHFASQKQLPETHIHTRQDSGGAVLRSLSQGPKGRLSFLLQIELARSAEPKQARTSLAGVEASCDSCVLKTSGFYFGLTRESFISVFVQNWVSELIVLWCFLCKASGHQVCNTLYPEVN